MTTPAALQRHAGHASHTIIGRPLVAIRSNDGESVSAMIENNLGSRGDRDDTPHIQHVAGTGNPAHCG
jgi:hypothetical protein